MFRNFIIYTLHLIVMVIGSRAEDVTRVGRC